NHSVLLFSGILDDGKKLSEEQLRFLLSLNSRIAATGKMDLSGLEGVHAANKNKRLKHLEDTDAALMQREFQKFNNWADDRIMELEVAIKDTRTEILKLEREAIREGLSSAEIVEIQEKISKSKKKQVRMRRELFMKEDEIMEERDAMLQDARDKLVRNIREEEVFTVAFEIV